MRYKIFKIFAQRRKHVMIISVFFLKENLRYGKCDKVSVLTRVISKKCTLNYFFSKQVFNYSWNFNCIIFYKYKANQHILKPTNALIN